MNKSINNQLLQEITGGKVFETFQTVLHVNDALLKYLLPVLAPIVVLTNLVVFILCLGIYFRIRKKHRKLPFIFIGFLALMDSLIGM